MDGLLSCVKWKREEEGRRRGGGRRREGGRGVRELQHHRDAR